MKKKLIRYRVWQLLLLTLLLPAGPVVAADDLYDFEIVIFERPGGGASEAWPGDPGEPNRAAARGRLDALAIGGKALGPVAYTLKKKGMIVHEHLAWRQKPQDQNSNSWYWIGNGRLSGLIRMSRGRYLHLDTDLLLRDARTSRPYRIKLHRRMRSGELHYVDHPKLGIMIQAERYSPAAASPGAGDAPSGEPKPAQPLATGGKPD